MGREDPAIAQVEQRMAVQIRDRYGTDVTTIDPARVRAEVTRAETLGSEAGQQHTLSAAELAQAQILSLKPTAKTSAPTRRAKRPGRSLISRTG